MNIWQDMRRSGHHSIQWLANMSSRASLYHLSTNAFELVDQGARWSLMPCNYGDMRIPNLAHSELSNRIVLLDDMMRMGLLALQ